MVYPETWWFWWFSIAILINPRLSFRGFDQPTTRFNICMQIGLGWTFFSSRASEACSGQTFRGTSMLKPPKRTKNTWPWGRCGFNLPRKFGTDLEKASLSTAGRWKFYEWWRVQWRNMVQQSPHHKKMSRPAFVLQGGRQCIAWEIS